ncbi:MAG: putative signal transduction histidine kinase [Mucilaginibacter sp.]|nr:putative signal transduction histidine kinase [Mucilaginibacter sp.]
MTVEFCYLLFITVDYYTVVYLIFPHFLKQKKYIYFVLYTFLLIAFSALLRALVARQMSLHFFKDNFHSDFSTLYFTSLLNIFIWVQLFIFGKMIVDKIYNQQRLAILEKEKVKQELDFLKAQINPHALFNSLNTIYGHIDKHNQAARNILLKFSGLLRYQLYDCSEDNISLEKEIEYIRNYISFQQIRKDEHLKVNVEIDAEPGNHIIAPLLLVVLIENAFKFVSSFTGRENRICINLNVTGNEFMFRVYNSTEHREAAPAFLDRGGIGIVNLKRRLELLYPGRHQLYFKEGENDYEATLKLQLA